MVKIVWKKKLNEKEKHGYFFGVNSLLFPSSYAIPVIKVYDLVEQERSAGGTCEPRTNQLVAISQVGVTRCTSVKTVTANVIEEYSTHLVRANMATRIQTIEKLVFRLSWPFLPHLNDKRYTSIINNNKLSNLL